RSRPELAPSRGSARGAHRRCTLRWKAKLIREGLVSRPATLVIGVAAFAVAGSVAAPRIAEGATPHLSTIGPAVTVGSHGNEPIVKEAPDGTLYISALEYLYV